MSEILKAWGGVQVRHNGIRISPYGDDDWLGIDADRGRRLGSPSSDLQAFAETLKGVDPQRALLSLISHKSYLGTVSIDSQDECFQPKANREGFMQSPAVDELRHFARYCIDWATICRDYWIRERKRVQAEEARKDFEETTERDAPSSEVVKVAAYHIQSQIQQIVKARSENERQAAASTVSPAIKAILAQDQVNEDELHHLRLITSSSTLLLIFSHEVKSFLSDIDNTEGIIEGMLGSFSGNAHSELNKLKLHLSESKTRFEQLLEMTALVGVDARKSKPVRLALRDRVEKAVSCFSLVIDSYEVDVDYSQMALNLLVGPMLEAELYAILLNALSNSLKSVIAGGKVKKINISANKIDNRVRLLISDTGIGLRSSRFEEVFTPFIADPEGMLYPGLDNRLDPADKHIVGTGSGLGLSIMKEIVNSLNGSVRFIKPKEPWSAQLEVLLV
jgi:K+-sensing histidine kinase KdpD